MTARQRIEPHRERKTNLRKGKGHPTNPCTPPVPLIGAERKVSGEKSGGGLNKGGEKGRDSQKKLERKNKKIIEKRKNRSEPVRRAGGERKGRKRKTFGRLKKGVTTMRRPDRKGVKNLNSH